MDERLAEWQQRTDAATDGPWEHEPYGAKNQNGDSAGGNLFDAHGEYVVSEVSDPDGAFMATTREAMPKLLAAVEAVLALHRDDAGTCVECSQGRSVTFPCPTLWAITDALEGGE